jgi:hypothetical protein
MTVHIRRCWSPVPPNGAARTSRWRVSRCRQACWCAWGITSLDAGVPLRDVQEKASHSDPRTTMRYDRARGSLDRHAT